MRLGIATNRINDEPIASPNEWAAHYAELGIGAVIFPASHQSGDKRIDQFVQACRDHDLVIAEVGAWRKP